MQYCSLQHWTLLLSLVPSTTGCCFALAPSLHSFGGYFSIDLQQHIGHLPTWGVFLSVSYHLAFSYCSWGSQGKNTEVSANPFSKECSNYCIIALISHASKVMLKILQTRLQQYVNQELPDVQAGFRKGRGTRDQIANICWIIKKAREFQKNIYLCFIDYT